METNSIKVKITGTFCSRAKKVFDPAAFPEEFKLDAAAIDLAAKHNEILKQHFAQNEISLPCLPVKGMRIDVSQFCEGLELDGEPVKPSKEIFEILAITVGKTGLTLTII